MRPFDLRGKRLGILGYGITGKALKGLADRIGAKAFVSDLREGDERENTYRILSCDVISPSPGIPPHHRVLNRAERSLIPIVSETEIGWNYIKGKVIGITGTNGKSTTAYFTHKLIPGSFICGNWGEPVSLYAFKSGIFVVEVSSFQLHYTYEFRPDIAVITNISPDHLDWHGSFKNYLMDKIKILVNQRKNDYAVLNCDDEYFHRYLVYVKGSLIKVSLKDPGSDLFSDGKVIFSPFGKFEIPKSLRKPYLIYDVMFSIACAGLVGIKDISIESFKPLKSRVEFVDEVKGVRFYDDSKGTNPHATRFAVESFEGKVILIMGGDDKNLDLSILRESVSKKVKSIVAIGRSKEKIKNLFSDITDVYCASTLVEAVEKAFRLSNGEPVLLSPSCASFDMFRDYKHRSEVFRKAVGLIKMRFQP